jgi:hypothetical protein
MVPEILHLTGLVFDIIGAVLMANMLLSTTHWRIWPRVFLSALVRGKIATGCASFDFRTENVIASLQGLALIIVGFIFSATGITIKMVSEYNHQTNERLCENIPQNTKTVESPTVDLLPSNYR